MALTNRQPGIVILGAFVLALAVGLALARLWWVLFGYLIVMAGPAHLVAYPWRRCRAYGCDGGRIWNSRRTVWDECAVCGGKGRRLRFLGVGARIRRAFGITT